MRYQSWKKWTNFAPRRRGYCTF